MPQTRKAKIMASTRKWSGPKKSNSTGQVLLLPRMGLSPFVAKEQPMLRRRLMALSWVLVAACMGFIIYMSLQEDPEVPKSAHWFLTTSTIVRPTSSCHFFSSSPAADQPQQTGTHFRSHHRLVPHLRLRHGVCPKVSDGHQAFLPDRSPG